MKEYFLHDGDKDYHPRFLCQRVPVLVHLGNDPEWKIQHTRPDTREECPLCQDIKAKEKILALD